jgi:uncharacterized cupin superfamily protein
MDSFPNTSFIALHNASEAILGPRQPKPTTQTPGQVESECEIWKQAGNESGLWECTPGTFRATRDGFTELCQFISGKAVVTSDDGTSATFNAGDTLITPSGWSGTWEIIETVRKMYVIIPDAV